MKANITQLAKATLIRLGEKKLHPTPANYAEVFDECAKEAGFSSKIQERIENFISKLDEVYRHELKHKRVRNEDELISFLIARINAQPAKKHKDMVDLFKFILSSLLISKDKKIKDLAAISMPKIVENMDLETIFLLKGKWRELRSNYELEPLFKELEAEGIKSNDFYHIISLFLSTLKDRSYKRISKLLLAGLKPCFGQSNVVDNFYQAMSSYPWIIGEKGFDNKYFKMLEKKNTADRIYVEKNLSFFQSNLSSIDELLASLFAKNDEDLQRFEAKKDSNGMVSFEELAKHFASLSEHLGQIKAKVSATQDSSARGDWTLLKEIGKLEENYTNYKVNYSLCGFKIKNAEFLMDELGLDNFNEMSQKLKNTLRHACLKNEELWIIDESSFLCVLPGSDEERAKTFENSVLSELEDYHFVYKERVLKLDLFSSSLGKQKHANKNILEILLEALGK